LKIIEKKLKKYLEDKSSYSIEINENLFSQKIIDSFGVVELVVFLENEFGINVDYEDLNEANFSTINDISLYVDRVLSEES